MMPIADYAFEGPFRSVEKIEDSPGVFAVVSEFVDKYYLLDVDHSDEVRKAIQNHERRNCWEKHRRGRIRFAVLYTADMTAEERGKLEEKIRREYKTIPCPAHPTEASDERR